MLLMLFGCEWKLRPSEEDDSRGLVEVNRYDRLQSLYLQTGDFSALQQMNTSYPMETRTLIENVLHLGSVDDPEINAKFLNFYQDTTLQAVISDAELQYANMDDINHSLATAFEKLAAQVPGFPLPMVYAQIGALDQSIVVGNQTIGISLDKYLGSDYPLYERFYTEQQRSSMNRSDIVPDCLIFYLLSLYSLPEFDSRTQTERDLHIGKIMWTVNRVMQKRVFQTPYVQRVNRYMRKHSSTTLEQLLKLNDYSAL